MILEMPIYLNNSCVDLVVNKFGIIESIFPENLNKVKEDSKTRLSEIIPKEIFNKHFEIFFNGKFNSSSNFIINGNNGFANKKVNVEVKTLKSTNKGENKLLIQFNKSNIKSENDNNYKHIFNSAFLGIYQIDIVKNKFLSVNPELARLLGFDSIDKLISENKQLQTLNINNPERYILKDLLQASDEIYGYESELLVNNSKVWISENIRAIKDKGVLKQVIGTVKNITERKILIEELQITKDDWQRTFDAIEEVIIILDNKLKIRRLNKAALKEYNTFADNPEGLFCTNLYNIGESHCNSCPARATILDGKPHSKEVEYESLGKIFYTSSLPILDDKGKFVGVVFIAKNITEKKKFKKESEKRLQQVILADRLKSLGELVANVAHEINNPNNFVVQNISLLEKSWKLFQPIVDDYVAHIANDEYDRSFYSDLSSEMVELIESIKVGSKRISSVVSNLKGFAQADEDKFGTISINDVIESSLKLIQSKIDKSFNLFKLNLEENIPNVYGDAHKLEQIIINLIVNSIQAKLENSSNELHINTKYIKRISGIYIEVKDNGQGISNDIIPHLFDPFFTTRRDDGGTGLGLSISQEIIKKHNGIIDVHSIVGKGTIFKIFLPLENETLNKLNYRMICVDNDESLFKKDIVCFLGEGKQTMNRISDAKGLCNYLEEHPEIDILLINASIVDNINILMEELKRINPLYELILFKIDKNYHEIFNNDGIKIVNTYNEKEIIFEINKILNSLGR